MQGIEILMQASTKSKAWWKETGAVSSDKDFIFVGLAPDDKDGDQITDPAQIAVYNAAVTSMGESITDDQREALAEYWGADWESRLTDLIETMARNAANAVWSVSPQSEYHRDNVLKLPEPPKEQKAKAGRERKF